jgi:hypothetical protein
VNKKSGLETVMSFLRISFLFGSSNVYGEEALGIFSVFVG